MKQGSRSALSHIYDEWHASIGPSGEATSPWHEMVKRHLPVMTGLTVLEIGCGRGEMTNWLVCQLPDLAIGADFSSTAVRLARSSRSGTSASFLAADITAIPAAENAFDLIVSCETVEHVVHPQRALTELYRVLHPAGVLLLTTPNYLNLIGLYRGYLRMRGRTFTEAGQPVNNFTSVPRVYWWLRRAGFSVEKIYTIGHYMPWPGRPPRRFPSLDSEAMPGRWLGHHSFFIARKTS
jgi:2-polyprenyl-3-methyl-5-hydroxy-6-metoxy-1,4-benzoquinol methylase